MHKAIRVALANSQQKVWFSALTGRAGRSVTLVYDAASEYPLWVAKTAFTPHSCQILEREQAMLEAVRPWAKELLIPETISWDCSGTEACLILTTVPGLHKHFTLPLYTEAAGRLTDLAPVLEWLDRFRKRVPAKILDKDATSDTLAALNLCSDECASLPAMMEILQSTDADEPVASHGDFWHCNLLFQGRRMGAVDWDSLAARSPTHDVFTLITGCRYQYGGHTEEHLNPTIFMSLFFSDSPVARYFRETIAQFHLKERQLHHAFYCFVGDSIRVTGQPWRNTWFDIARILQQAGFPAPWTCSLDADSSRERRVGL